MAKIKVNKIKVAAAYIGIIVGAGFASGQEILQFFGYFGGYGLIGLILSGILFSFFGYLILNLGRKLKADSHQPLIKYIGGKYLGTIIDYVITFFLFGVLTVMAAGGGALFEEQFGVSRLLGSALIMIFALIPVILGISGVINAISIVTPILLFAVLAITVITISKFGFTTDRVVKGIEGSPTIPFWFVTSILYVSYNLIMAVAVLAPLGKQTDDRMTLKVGAVLGGIGLTICAGAIYLSLSTVMSRDGELAIPMIYVVSQISPTAQILYAIVILAELYTTAVGSLYGFAARLISPSHPDNWKYVIGISIAAFTFSQIGFTNLVRYLFPLVGLMGLLMLAALIWYYLKEKEIPQIFERFLSIVKSKFTSKLASKFIVKVILKIIPQNTSSFIPKAAFKKKQKPKRE